MSFVAGFLESDVHVWPFFFFFLTKQGDVNRTLEELAAQVEALKNQSVRKRMLKSLDDPATIELLESWECFRKTSIVGERQIRTTVEEAQHLERRAGLLSNVLDLVADTDLRDQISAVKCKLDRLVQQCNRTVGGGGGSTGGSGGCFEWMDSLLVKALRQGHWLLVDNVNLCSPSVLDRLNGLLEPSGVLSLSERGVIDGGIPVVAPHPNFRLFLALDPRYGEISRAMRNRGVELFLSGGADDESDPTYSDSDLDSVLCNAGLSSPLLQNTLLAFHRWLEQQLPQGERPTLTELVQAASLAAQRLEMFSTTANPLSCLDDTCVEVYIRPIRSPTDKEAARLQLAHLLQEAFASADSTISHRIPAPVALSTGDIQLCSTMARVRQAAKLVTLSDPEDREAAALLFYLTATCLDLDWRQDYLAETSGVDTTLYRDTLKTQLTGLKDSHSALPWDPRWFSHLCRTHFNAEVDADSEFAVNNNRILLSMFWTAWMNTASASTTGSATGGRTVGTFSRAIESGALAEEAAPHKLLVVVPRFLQQYDQVVWRLLNSHQVQLTHAQWVELMEAVLMRLHMKDIDVLCLEEGEMEGSISRLAQYWTWLMKKSVPAVARLLQRFPLASLDLPADEAGQVGAVLSRRLRRWMERVEPFADQFQSVVVRLISSVLTAASLPAVAASQRGTELLRDFARLLSSPSTSSPGDGTDIRSSLLRLERELQETASSTEQSPSTSLPVLSLLDHLLLLQHFSKWNSSPPNNLMMTTVPTASSALLQSRSTSIQSWAEWHLFHWEIVTRLALSRCDGQFAVTSPLFSITAAGVLDRNGLVTLGESDEKKERLETLEKIFWNNADQLQRTDFDPLLNDHQLAVASLHRLIEGVGTALRIPGLQPEAWNDVGIPVSAAEAVLLALQSTDDPANLGSLWLLQGLARCLLLTPSDNVDPVEKRKLKAVLRRREAEQTDRFLRVYKTHRRILVGTKMSLATQHPCVRHLSRVKQRLDSELAEERTQNSTWRPSTSLFQQLVKDIRHYVHSVASPQTVMALHDKLRGLQSGRTESQQIMAQAALWLNAQRNFYQSLKSKYVDYPDLFIPFAAGVGQMIHGAELLVRRVRGVAWRSDLPPSETDLNDSLADLFECPSKVVAGRSAGVVALTHLCTSSDIGGLFDAVFEDPAERNINKKTLLFSALKDIQRYASHARRIDSAAWTSQLAILDALVASWTASEERRKQREIDQESLYRSRTIHHDGELSDAEADKRALEKYFPSYEEQFADDNAAIPMETEGGVPQDDTVIDFELTPDDMVGAIRSLDSFASPLLLMAPFV